MLKRLLHLFISILTVFQLFSCATDPGTSTPVAGSAITFTYAQGKVNVVVNVDGTTITAAAVLYDLDPGTGQAAPATQFEDGVSVVWWNRFFQLVKWNLA